MKHELPPCPATEHLECAFAALLGQIPRPTPIPEPKGNDDDECRR